MLIRTQLLKYWVGPDPEKHIGCTPLTVTRAGKNTGLLKRFFLGFYGFLYEDRTLNTVSYQRQISSK